MESVTVTRTLDASVEAMEAELADLESFMLSAGFDEVSVEDDRMTLVMGFTLLRMKLVLDLVESDEHDIVYEQHEGPFESMRTWYDVEPVADADGPRTRVSATTEFQLRAPAVGSLLDATIITRQRRKELDAQFDYLESALEGGAGDGAGGGADDAEGGVDEADGEDPDDSDGGAQPTDERNGAETG